MNGISVVLVVVVTNGQTHIFMPMRMRFVEVRETAKTFDAFGDGFLIDFSMRFFSCFILLLRLCVCVSD